MSGAVYHCPFCIVGGQYRPMIPLGQSDEYRCGGCGHMIVEGNPFYVCTCFRCKATRAKEYGREALQETSGSRTRRGHHSLLSRLSRE